MSHGFWQRNFGGQPSALGKTLTLNDKPYTVIGIMPQSFRFPYPGHLPGKLFQDDGYPRQEGA